MQVMRHLGLLLLPSLHPVDKDLQSVIAMVLRNVRQSFQVFKAKLCQALK